MWLLTEIADSLPHLLIVCAGSIGDAFYDRVVPPNLVVTGVISDASRRSLLRSASVALNPMRIGSGTNLKLVEYLANRIPTVSTPFGARGLQAVSGEHLVLAEPDGFADAVEQLLADPETADDLAAAGHDLVAGGLDWPSPLADQLTQVVRTAAACWRPSTSRVTPTTRARRTRRWRTTRPRADASAASNDARRATWAVRAAPHRQRQLDAVLKRRLGSPARP